MPGSVCTEAQRAETTHTEEKMSVGPLGGVSYTEDGVMRLASQETSLPTLKYNVSGNPDSDQHTFFFLLCGVSAVCKQRAWGMVRNHAPVKTRLSRH